MPDGDPSVHLRLPPSHASSTLLTYAHALATFFRTYAYLWQHHAVDFYTCNYFRTVLPEEWRDPLMKLSFDDLLALGAGVPPVDQSWPESLKTFVEESRSLPLPRHPAGDPLAEMLERQAIQLDCHQLQGMSPKKQHEVLLLASLIDHIASTLETSQHRLGILDLGAGQGYLDTVLAHSYGRTVIGVDDDEVQTCGAKRRNEKLTKAHSKNKKRKADDASGTDRVQEMGEVYHINRRVHAGEAFEDLLREVQKEMDGAGPEESSARLETVADNQQWLLCGLHACGDLTPAMFRHFLNSTARAVVCVSCCYNKLTESPLPSPSAASTNSVPAWESTKDLRLRSVIDTTTLTYQRALESMSDGYPLSRYFRRHRSTFGLGYTARTLACQATGRWWVGEGGEGSPESGARDAYRRHFYRALLQVVVEERGLIDHIKALRPSTEVTPKAPGGQDGASAGAGDPGLVIGRLRPHAFANGFPHYAQTALGRLGLKDLDALGLDTAALKRYEDEYESREKELAAVWTLRAMMGAAAESLIVVDRAVWLAEVAAGVSEEEDFDVDVVEDGRLVQVRAGVRDDKGSEAARKGAALRVRIFPLFNLVDSPRNIVVVAEKV
ncbi:hypothetical protein HDU96_005525 [Phlyctochytrium bullatum]|nr:hypothetical protein HDU96_005525 [Phlyctochytrium bullatum]